MGSEVVEQAFINWADPEAKISKYFTVREALYLSRWKRLATADDHLSDHVKLRIHLLAKRMDMVREFIGLPIIVHSWYRPPGYNAVVGGSMGSKHLCIGNHSAVDWHADLEGAESIAESCDTLRATLEPKLQEFGLRMEKKPGSAWVHLDDAVLVQARYFVP